MLRTSILKDVKSNKEESQSLSERAAMLGTVLVRELQRLKIGDLEACSEHVRSLEMLVAFFLEDFPI
jgi:hypothetical protein